MQKTLLKAIIKSNSQAKKTANELIDEFIKTQGKIASEHLEEFLSSLLVYINKNYDNINHETLLPLINSKLQDLNIPVNTNDVEIIYAKLATTHILSQTFEFDKVDVKAVESMRKGFYWAGVEHGEKTQNKLKDIIEGAFKGEYPRVEISSKLKEEFTGVLNASTDYFELVADNVINQSQNISKVNQALKYDVKHFKVSAIIDAKTSQVCRSMNGRIIESSHLKTQTDNVLAAKNISEKKAAATWKNNAVYGKLDSNFGLPPYHGRCRTELVAVWINEEIKIDKETGKKYKIKNTKNSTKHKLIHIDKAGVEVRVKADKYDKIINKKHNLTEKQLVGALNDIKYKAPHTITGKHPNEHMRSVALTNSGYTLVYEADELITCFAPKKGGKSYFNEWAVENKIVDIDTGDTIQRVKKWYENLI